MANNVDDQLRLNDYRLSLVRLVGPALVALVTLGQLGASNRFNIKGPTWLDPASLSALVACGFFFALYYGNTTYVSAHLRKRLAVPEGDADRITGTESLPTNTKVPKKVRWAFFEYTIGFLLLFGAVGFFVAFLWT